MTMKNEKTVIDKGYEKTIFWPGLPDIFSKDYEEQAIDIAPDGTQFLRAWASFRGESGEVREELEKILENWPDGIFANGKFSVDVGVNVKINGTDWEINPQTLSSE